MMGLIFFAIVTLLGVFPHVICKSFSHKLFCFKDWKMCPYLHKENKNRVLRQPQTDGRKLVDPPVALFFTRGRLWRPPPSRWGPTSTLPCQGRWWPGCAGASGSARAGAQCTGTSHRRSDKNGILIDDASQRWGLRKLGLGRILGGKVDVSYSLRDKIFICWLLCKQEQTLFKDLPAEYTNEEKIQRMQEKTILGQRIPTRGEDM